MINLKEFAVFLQQIDLQPALSTSSIRQLFTVFDETHSGFINFFEFCHVVFPELDVEGMAEDAEGFSYCIPAFELNRGAPGGQAGGQGAGGAMGPYCNSSSAPSSECAKPTLHALARGHSKGSLGSLGSLGSMGSGCSSSKSTSAAASPTKTPRPSPLRGPLKAGPVAERLGIGSDAGAAGAAGAAAADDDSQSPSKRRSVPPVPPFRGKPAGSTDSPTEEAKAEGSLVRVLAQNAVPAPAPAAAPAAAPAEAEGAKPEGGTSTHDAAEKPAEQAALGSVAPSPALGSVAPSPALGAVPPSRSWDGLGALRAGQGMTGQWGRSRPEDAQRARLRGLAGGRGAWGGSLGRLPVGEGSPALGAAPWGDAAGLGAQLDEMVERLAQAVRGAEEKLARVVSQSEAKMAERLDKLEASVAVGFAEAKAAADAAAAEAADPVKLRLAQKQMHKITITPPAHLSPPTESRVSKRGGVPSGLLSGCTSNRSGDSGSGDSRESHRSGDRSDNSRESRVTRAESKRQTSSPNSQSASTTEV